MKETVVYVPLGSSYTTYQVVGHVTYHALGLISFTDDTGAKVTVSGPFIVKEREKK